MPRIRLCLWYIYIHILLVSFLWLGKAAHALHFLHQGGSSRRVTRILWKNHRTLATEIPQRASHAKYNRHSRCSYSHKSCLTALQSIPADDLGALSFNETLPERRTVESTSPATKAPDTRTILKFAIPAIGIWLCSPLMSIIDTASVGLISGTAQQVSPL